MHHLRGLVPPDQIPCPLEGLSAFGGGPQDCKIKQGRYPTTPLANRCEILAPDLRDSVRAHGKLSLLLGTNLGPTGGLVGGMSK